MRPFSVFLAGTLLVFGLNGGSLAASKTAAVKKDGVTAPKSTPAKRTAEDPNIAELRKLLKQPEGYIDLAKAKVAIDHMFDPKVDVPGTLRLLDQWAAKVRARFPPGASNKLKLELLVSTLYDPGPWNDYRPFGYDFDDPIDKDLRNTLLSTYLARRKGQCVIMPITFVLLGQKLGLPVTLTTAPNHVVAKYGDEEKGEWMNLEATSGRSYYDSGYMQALEISPEVMKQGTFLRPYSQRESVALFATALLAPFYRQKRQPERLLQVTALILEANPKDVVAMTHRADAHYLLIEQRFTSDPRLIDQLPPEQHAEYVSLSRENFAWYAKAESLGWRQQTKTQWANYLKHFEKEKEKEKQKTVGQRGDK